MGRQLTLWCLLTASRPSNMDQWEFQGDLGGLLVLIYLGQMFALTK